MLITCFVDCQISFLIHLGWESAKPLLIYYVVCNFNSEASIIAIGLFSQVNWGGESLFL